MERRQYLAYVPQGGATVGTSQNQLTLPQSHVQSPFWSPYFTHT